MPDFWTRLKYAVRSFLPILIRAELPEDVAAALLRRKSSSSSLVATVAKTVEKDDRPDRAVQVLSLFQRDGRLIDFLSEEIAAYPDAQLGAAVRTVHESCRQVLRRYFSMAPIIDSEEDQPVMLAPGFDVSEIKLIGNVAGQPPIRGLLRHRGWRIQKADLPSLPQGTGRMIVAPAEVEVP